MLQLGPTQENERRVSPELNSLTLFGGFIGAAIIKGEESMAIMVELLFHQYYEHQSFCDA